MNTRASSRSLWVLMILALVATLAACGDDDGSSDSSASDTPDTSDSTDATEEPVEAAEVTLAIPSPSLNFLPYMITTDRELGFYEDEGIELSVEVLRGDAALAGIQGGSVQFTAAGGTAMRAALNGGPFRAVMMTVGQTTFSVIGKSDITSVADLRGRTIGLVGSGLQDTSGVALRGVLASEGMDPEKDVDIFVAPTPPETLAALIGGSLDAAVLAPPQSQIAIEEGFVEIAKGWDHVELTQGQVATSTSLLEDDPELVKRFLRASVAAINYVVDNPDEVVEYIVERFELSESVARASYEVLREAYLTDGRPTDEAALGELPPGSSVEDLAKVADFSLLEDALAEG